MPNVRILICASNKSKIRMQQAQEPVCKCRQRPCPLNGQCSIRDVVYRADIRDAPEPYFYIGSTAVKFIQSFHLYKHSFNNRGSRNSTSLSMILWQLRNQGHDPKVAFSVISQTKSAGTCSPTCNLCLWEKLQIINKWSPHLLYSRNKVSASASTEPDGSWRS